MLSKLTPIPSGMAPERSGAYFRRVADLSQHGSEIAWTTLIKAVFISPTGWDTGVLVVKKSGRQVVRNVYLREHFLPR